MIDAAYANLPSQHAGMQSQAAPVRRVRAWLPRAARRASPAHGAPPGRRRAARRPLHAGHAERQPPVRLEARGRRLRRRPRGDRAKPWRSGPTASSCSRTGRSCGPKPRSSSTRATARRPTIDSSATRARSRRAMLLNVQLLRDLHGLRRGARGDRLDGRGGKPAVRPHRRSEPARHRAPRRTDAVGRRLRRQPRGLRKERRG